MRYTIALARPSDLASLPAIELAAARLLEGHAPESILAESTSLDDLRAAQADGRLWVALADDEPVGFAIVEMLADGLPHLDEIDVHPEHRTPEGTARDNQRDDAADTIGWFVRRVSEVQLVDHFAETIDAVTASIARRR